MAERAGTHWREVFTALWARRTWLAVIQLVSGGVLWLVPVVMTVAVIGLAVRKALGGSKAAFLGEALVVMLLAFVVLVSLTSQFTAMQRARFRVVRGEDLVPFGPPPPDQGRLRALVSRRTWRQVRYHAVGGLLTAVAAGTVLTALVLGAGAIVVALTRSETHGGRALTAIVLAAAVLVVLPWLARGAAALDLAMARALLQPSAAEILARRVETLSASRAGAVDAADAERRRIERDLHDGTQQRLVSLAMNLGLTRDAVRDAPPEVREAVAAAHEEAKLALAELRGFIRGLHPAVLDELGLDAALSGIAARSPVPVRLSVALDARPPAAVETVAYFVVSEALTNAARHAGATRVGVDVRRGPEGLLLSVTDDGRGGADPARGTGLRGLAQRVDSVDGTLRIDSPPGGPTTITVALPCAS